jgi:hypothetical protein
MSIFNKLSGLLAIFILGFALITFSTPVFAATTPLLPTAKTICESGGGGNCAVIGGEAGASKISDGGATGVVNTLISVSRVITFIAGGLSVLFLVYGGVRYLISEDEKGAGTARNIIQNAIIGLIITVIAYSIITIVTGLLSGQFIFS